MLQKSAEARKPWPQSRAARASRRSTTTKMSTKVPIWVGSKLARAGAPPAQTKAACFTASPQIWGRYCKLAWELQKRQQQNLVVCESELIDLIGTCTVSLPNPPRTGCNCTTPARECRIAQVSVRPPPERPGHAHALSKAGGGLLSCVGDASCCSHCFRSEVSTSEPTAQARSNRPVRVQAKAWSASASTAHRQEHSLVVH